MGPTRRDTVSADSTSETIGDRKSTRLNSSHDQISYAVFCLKKKKNSALLTSTPAMSTLIMLRCLFWWRAHGDSKPEIKPHSDSPFAQSSRVFSFSSYPIPVS